MKIKSSVDDIVEFLKNYLPCRRCKGYVQDGTIICIHCGQHDPIEGKQPGWLGIW